MPSTPSSTSARARRRGARRSQITISGLAVDVHFKDIKNVHIAVYPPDGRVRVAAPARLGEDAVRLAVVKRFGWIKQQRAELQAAERVSERELLDGESNYVWGRRYRLRVIESSSRPGVRIDGERLILTVKPDTTARSRAVMLARWERRQLRERIPELIDKWTAAMGISVGGWGTRRMKTKWGSYSSRTGRIWMNTELAKKHPRCLEYIVVHELAHAVERGHGEAFVALMDQHLPDWRNRHHELNNAPLSAENWPD